MAKKKPAPKKKPTKQVEGHMDITAVVALAQKIHDAEHINLGSASTREYRNAFWARVIGCAHHGHKVYNATPDKQWHLKSGGGGRPQSDDVAVSMPSKQFWDCVPGSGADGYSFRASGPEILDAPPQVVFAPPVPDGSGVQPKPTPKPPKPTAPDYPPYPGDPFWDEFGGIFVADLARAGQTPNAQSFRWAGRVIHDFYTKVVPSMDASVAKHRAGWCAVLGIPVQ